MSLVLDGVEEKVILLFEDGKHGLPAGRGPTTKYHGHFVLINQFFCPPGKGWPIRSSVLFNRNDRQALALDVEPAGRIDLVNRKQLGLRDGVLGNRHGAGSRVKKSNLNIAIELLGNGRFASACQKPQCAPQHNG